MGTSSALPGTDSLIEGCCVIELIFDERGQAVDFRYLETNPAFIKHATRPMLGMRIKEIVPDFEQFWLDQYGHVATTGEPVRLEHIVAGLGNQWFRTSAFRLGGPGSRRVAVLFENITERKRAEEALRESEERFRVLIHNVQSAVALVDGRGAFLVVNQSFRRMFDIPEDADILNVTSRGLGAVAARAVDAGFDGHVAKPPDPDRIARLLS